MYEHIFCIVYLLKNINQEEDFSGVLLGSIAEALSLPLKRLECICGLFVNFTQLSRVEIK